MAELLASNQDVNTWLADDKLEANDANTAQFQIDAWRTIRGQLASIFEPLVLAGWVGPTTTPDAIRQIAGRLIAAYLYRKVYSEDSENIPAYAQELYNEAIQMLTDIRTNKLIVVDVNDVPISTNLLALSSADFWPNNETPGPYFTMDQTFG